MPTFEDTESLGIKKGCAGDISHQLALGEIKISWHPALLADAAACTLVRGLIRKANFATPDLLAVGRRNYSVEGQGHNHVAPTK